MIRHQTANDYFPRFAWRQRLQPRFRIKRPDGIKPYDRLWRFTVRRL